MTKRPRRRFSKEFKREAVRLVRDSGKNLSQISRELGVQTSVLSAWKAMVEAEEKTGLTPDELEELKQLRKDKARLEMEVEILGKATASSTGHRYTCVERIRWSSEPQGLAWPLVELTRDLVQLGL